MTTDNTCQHCGEAVSFSRNPTDANYAAFVHASGAIACEMHSAFGISSPAPIISERRA